MSTFKYLDRIKKFDQLLRLKCTGRPKDVAAKLGISESMFYQLLQDMKSMGAPIGYCKARQSYYYTKKVKFHVGFFEQMELYPQQQPRGH